MGTLPNAGSRDVTLTPSNMESIVPPWKARANRLAVLGMLLAFVVAGLVRFRDVDGDDLAAGFVGCRLVAAGQAQHLYAHDPVDFAAIGPDDPWQAAADAGGFTGFLHPYVQTPLWAWALQPLCLHTKFARFRSVFETMELLSFAGLMLLVAWMWAPEMLHPAGIAVVLVWLWSTTFFGYAMMLMQTHVLFLLATLGALALAEKRRPVAAGILLALAAAVKVTPGILILYWLLTKRYKAAATMAVASAVLLGLAVGATGPTVFAAYLADVKRISNVLLLSQNNQSFAAAVMTHLRGYDETTQFDMQTLPAGLRMISNGLLVVFTVVGGLLDRSRRWGDTNERNFQWGAQIALIGATVFAPIAWTHYSIVLIAPVMMLLALAWRTRSWWVAGAVVVVMAMCLQPLATDVEAGSIGRLALLHGQFYAELLCAGLLAITAGRLARRQDSTGFAAEPEEEEEQLPSAASHLRR